MFCPACGAEYRSGVTECFDCHVALMSAQPPRKREALRQDYAPLWKRALGQIIDGIIFTAPAFGFGFLIGADALEDARVKVVLPAAAVLIAAACAYIFPADALPGGQSFGKRILGI